MSGHGHAEQALFCAAREPAWQACPELEFLKSEVEGVRRAGRASVFKPGLDRPPPPG
jgi:hypothetical protein